MMIETAPSAVHLAANDLPFADIGGGNKMKVIQVIEKEGLWIIENIFMKGFEVQPHRHTGPVWGYTVSGGWKYKEYDYVNRAGSFLYEPAGSIHTLQCIEDNTQVYEVPAGHFFMMGDNRDNSTDSRVPPANGGVGYVPFDNLVGRAQIIFFSVGGGENVLEFWKWPWTVRWDRMFKLV